MMSRLGLLAAVAVIGSASIASRPACAAPAEDTEEPRAPPSTEAPAVVAPTEAPAPAEALSAQAMPPRPPARDVAFGLAVRARYVSVPGWLLGFFTKQNVPLETFGHVGIEGFRRAGNFQVTLGLSYQNMSPPDGNWLGSGRDPAVDTRLLRFRGLSLYSADIAFTGQGMLTPWFGLHAGAGLGVAVVRGSVYVDVSQGCTDANVGDASQCHPTGITCANGVCTPPPNHAGSGGVLPLLPIVDVLAGVDFRLPDVKGWEAKIEGGFFDAFFFGLGIGYTF